MFNQVSSPCKEFEFQGVQMRGPAASLGKAGAGGKHANNVRRDWFRQMGRMDVDHRAARIFPYGSTYIIYLLRRQLDPPSLHK